MHLKVLLNSNQLQFTLKRLAYHLVEDYTSLQNVVFIGLQPRGTAVSDKIISLIQAVLPHEPIQYGVLDITFYRDDIREELHQPAKTDINFSIEGKQVVLIDDVLHTGRTIRAALDALNDFGRPSAVKLCVLVNRRFSRQLPIQPDYCGIAIDTSPSQKVKLNKQTNEVELY